MRITECQLFRLHIRMAEPISISFHTFTHYENFLVKLVGANGLVGWGEGAPFERITGDNEQQALSEAARLAASGLPELVDARQFYEQVASVVASSSLRAALDFAAYDLLGCEQGLPVFKLLSPSVRTVPNSVTVFLKDSPDETAREAARIIALYPHLKVMKIKLRGGEGDIERCRAIKSVSPAGLRFMLDANQGFKSAEAAVLALGEIVAALGQVLLCEEPCPRGDYISMRAITESGVVPVYADESCCGLQDLEKLIESRCVSGINIKLQKAGGITPARELAARAAAAGLGVMVGQMFESTLGTAAGLHFAISTPNVMVTDLDMDLELPDFASGRAEFKDGVRMPLSNHAGFGFDLDMEAVERLAAKGDLVFKRLL